MKYCKWLILIALCTFAMVNISQDNSDVEMISWEEQSWKTSGGSSRITIWADGRSEAKVVPEAYIQNHPKLRPRDGWAMKRDENGVHFVRTNVFSVQVAKEKFQQALAAGIRLLETFKIDYTDGGGTVVGVQTDGKLKETLIPLFPDQAIGSPNHKRFKAVSKALSEFDRKAYETED